MGIRGSADQDSKDDYDKGIIADIRQTVKTHWPEKDDFVLCELALEKVFLRKF